MSVNTTAFNFDAAVVAPFRMQPGLRRLAPGAQQLTAAAPGGRHMREKLAVLSAFAPQALLCADGFDAGPALHALLERATAEHPAAVQILGDGIEALGVRVDGQSAIEQTAAGLFGLGDEVPRCLRALPPPWRRAGLLSLALAEDFAVIEVRQPAEGNAGTGWIPWLAVALPSHWAPEDKVGRDFDAVHAPVADGEALRRAGPALAQTVTGGGRWERFVWSLSGSPRLHAHPARTEREPAFPFDPGLVWWRTERQTFLPVPGHAQAVFTIHVEVQPLAAAIDTPQRAARLLASLASMSPAVQAYRGLGGIRAPLLDWLTARAEGAGGAGGAGGAADGTLA